MRPWVTFFSQTGTEIYELSNALGVYPDCVVHNKHNTNGVNPKLVELTTFRATKLNMMHCWQHLPPNPNVTIPRQICEKYEIYNLHPGLIDKFPSLKGFNPQQRAFAEGYDVAGCVIHRVTPGVDEGEILMSQGVDIKNKTLDEVYSALRVTALDLWKSFFTAFKILEQ